MLNQIVSGARVHRHAKKYTKGKYKRMSVTQARYPTRRQYNKNPTQYRSATGNVDISGRRRLNKAQRSGLNKRDTALYNTRRIKRQHRAVGRVAGVATAVGLANQISKAKYGKALPGLGGIAPKFKMRAKVSYPGMPSKGSRRMYLLGANLSPGRGGAQSYFQPRGLGGRVTIRIPNKIAFRTMRTARTGQKALGKARMHKTNLRSTFNVGKGGRVRRDYKGRFSGWS